jgi:hypothetical protein
MFTKKFKKISALKTVRGSSVTKKRVYQITQLQMSDYVTRQVYRIEELKCCKLKADGITWNFPVFHFTNYYILVQAQHLRECW